ncbi:hypothetical protein ED733_007688 [Metarhizium rileyi]|uniref:C2H2-type domain-containing protein n=1 Tax=Metarhizium rileyi (strain RCEF 4871) TaxID=1649241 RepID=A0A5C6GEA6_METRR|nr:hypothetical protein ED733_007688 [Metarhizium rileyi]
MDARPNSVHLPIAYDTAKPHFTSYRKKFPESLRFESANFRQSARSVSTRSSISSANIPDSATADSPSTLASPLSSSQASDIQERFACHTLDGSRPPSRIHHRHRLSVATCSTFINDDDESPLYVGYHDLFPELDLCPELDQARSNHSTPVSTLAEIDESETGATPMTEEDDDLTPGKTICWEQHQTPCTSPAQKSDISFTAFGETISSDDADGILDYTLQLVYGIELSEAQASTGALHELVSKFVRELGQHIWQTPLDGQVSQTSTGPSSSNTPSTGSGAEIPQGFGKRKKQTNREDDGEELTDGEGPGYVPSKRTKSSPREDENLRLSCPYRKRNPSRFNVRDHHSCAMTYFPKFAELRQHIVKQHKRDDPSAFVCDRCTQDFRTRKELRDHQRQPKEHMCDISDHDPEAGIDGPTSNKLLSRKRVSGASPEVQWKEIWNILFPDDDDNLVKSYNFTPVIEHFELSALYLEAFDYLQASLQDKISNPATLDTIVTKIYHCFIETMDRCVLTSQNMPYTNRSNKRNEPLRTQNTQSLIGGKPRVAAGRPDSGVVIDDTSEESGSMSGSSSLVHRDSLRTVTSCATRRESNLVPKSNADMCPTPVVADGLSQNCAAPCSAFTFGADMAMPHATASAVQEWARNMSFTRDNVIFGNTDTWFADINRTPQVDFGLDDSLLYEANICTVENTFANLRGSNDDETI